MIPSSQLIAKSGYPSDSICETRQGPLAFLHYANEASFFKAVDCAARQGDCPAPQLNLPSTHRALQNSISDDPKHRIPLRVLDGHGADLLPARAPLVVDLTESMIIAISVSFVSDAEIY